MYLLETLIIERKITRRLQNGVAKDQIISENPNLASRIPTLKFKKSQTYSTAAAAPSAAEQQQKQFIEQQKQFLIKQQNQMDLMQQQITALINLQKGQNIQSSSTPMDESLPNIKFNNKRRKSTSSEEEEDQPPRQRAPPGRQEVINRPAIRDLPQEADPPPRGKPTSGGSNEEEGSQEVSKKTSKLPLPSGAAPSAAVPPVPPGSNVKGGEKAWFSWGQEGRSL